MRSDDMGLERREIDFDDLVVVVLRRLADFGVGHQQSLDRQRPSLPDRSRSVMFR